MYDFGMTKRAVEKYEASINKFIGESLNINYEKPSLLDKIKLKLSPAIIVRQKNARQKTDDPFKEIVRIYRKQKLISEKEFQLKTIIRN